MDDLSDIPLASDDVGLLEGLCTTRAIRRYVREPIPKEVLRDIFFAATRAPSGSNRQPFRFLVLGDSETARRAKLLVKHGAQELWAGKQVSDGYVDASEREATSPKARMASAMQEYVDHFDTVPLLVLAILLRYRPPTPAEGASIYPACQNLLLAARARGYGGVITGFHTYVESELRELLAIPDDAFIAATITLGRPRGAHGPVRRVPMRDVVFEDSWGDSAAWAVDPPGSRFTGRPPR